MLRLLLAGLFAVSGVHAAEETAPAVKGAKAGKKEKAKEVTVVDAKLVKATRQPTAKAVLPYRRALATSLYEVKRVRKGTYSGKQILVVRWVVWNGAQVPVPGPAPAVGEVVRLRLTPLAGRPEYRNDYIVDDVDEKEMVLYLDNGQTGLIEESGNQGEKPRGASKTQ